MERDTRNGKEPTMSNLERMIEVANAQDAARAVESMVRADPQRMLAYVIVGLVAVVAAFTLRAAWGRQS